MADRAALHRPGTPCWVVLVTPDADRTGPFYAGLFGWSVTAPPGGFAVVARPGGQEVAGVLQLPPEAARAGAASRWLVFFATDDVGKTLEVVGPAGGEVLAPAFDVGDLARLAIVADCTGAQFGLWQAGDWPCCATPWGPCSTWRRRKLSPSASRRGGGTAVPPSSPRTPRRSSAWLRTAGG